MQKPQTKSKVLLTGGHAGTSAIAVVSGIKKQKLPWKMYWVGPAKAYQGKEIASYESEVMKKLGVESFSLDSSKAQRTSPFAVLKFILKLPLGLLDALRIVDDIRPDIILSFGGYVAFPVVIIGKLLGSRIIIHEQVVTVGIANRFTKYFADTIALGWKQSFRYYPKKKSVYVGLPIREKILEVKPKDILGKPATVLIMGGSRGSVPINDLVIPILPKMLERWKVIHISGKLDYDRLKALSRKLSTSKENYELRPFLNTKQMAGAYSTSDIIISRSGAHSVNELMYIKRPSILIPLPLTNSREQDKNADIARRAGVSRVFAQSDIFSTELYRQIEDMLLNWKKIRKDMGERDLVKIDATEKLIDLVIEKLL